MKQDIKTEKDIRLFLDAFYVKVRGDDTIGYIFNEVANLDWDAHMIKIYKFWESILLGKPGFQGDVMGAHIKLNRKERLKTEHFDRWITLFNETVNEFFKGPIADEAINRAATIRRTMEHHVQNS